MKKKFEKGQLVERVRDNERVVGRVVEHTILAGELYVVLEHNYPNKCTSVWPATSLSASDNPDHYYDNQPTN